MEDENFIGVSVVDNFSPKKSPSECGSNLGNIAIKYMDTEFILGEPAEKIPVFSKKKSIVHYSNPAFSEDEEAIVPHSIVTTNYEPNSSYEECILPDSPPLDEHSDSGFSPASMEKLTKNSALWKCNIKKLPRENVKTFGRTRKLVGPAKTMKPPCKNCILTCSNIFTAEDRMQIFQSFWNLNNHEKFYFKFVVRKPVKRRSVKSKEKVKQFSFQYFLEKNQTLHRVCRLFFINTLGIHQKRIYYYFANLNNIKPSSPIPRKESKTLKPPKTPKPPCSACGFACAHVFTAEDRLKICQTFWNLTDRERKKFYLKFILQKSIQRGKNITETNRKNISLTYFLEKNNTMRRVCRTFFLNTLCISQMRIYYCFEKLLKNKNSAAPLSRNKGKIIKRNKSLSESNFPLSVTDNLKINSELLKSYQRKCVKPKVSMRKEVIKDRKLKPPCNDCIFKCLDNFTAEDRLNIFQSFWQMTDYEKNCFYLKFVQRNPVQRRRVKSDENVKQFSFHYYLEKNESLHRVCRLFFVNTLSIHQKRIYYCFANNISGCSPPRKNGENIKRKVSNNLLEVRQHIASIPAVDSHYCQLNSEIKYVESSLNLDKMYNLYLESSRDPVGLSLYRRVFNNEFNISFLNSKMDQCDKCVINVKTTSEKEILEQHIAEYIALKDDCDRDRKNVDQNKCIICYDLQSNFQLPKGNASLYCYKRKLNIYMLTATVIMPNVNNYTYSALWPETHSDDQGNDIASALIKILKELIKELPYLKTLILWSDSSVPKSYINTFAIKIFLKKSSNIKKIIQKFSEPGHSLITEVDKVHEVIDKYLRKVEIHSPLHLIKLLENISSKKSIQLKILPMLPTDFHQYSVLANKIDFRKVPFSEIKIMLYEKSNEFQIQFKNSIRDLKFKQFYILKLPAKKSLPKRLNIFEQKMEILPTSSISEEKKKDIKDLLIFLPDLDKKYYENLFKS